MNVQVLSYRNYPESLWCYTYFFGTYTSKRVAAHAAQPEAATTKQLHASVLTFMFGWFGYHAAKQVMVGGSIHGAV